MHADASFDYVFVISRSLVRVVASDRCQTEKRKTINGDDLLWAMTTLGFESYLEPLKIYLGKYRQVCVFACNAACPRL